jgi:hypothetical protein
LRDSCRTRTPGRAREPRALARLAGAGGGRAAALKAPLANADPDIRWATLERWRHRSHGVRDFVSDIEAFLEMNLRRHRVAAADAIRQSRRRSR